MEYDDEMRNVDITEDKDLPEDAKRYFRILDSFKGKKVLVLGDFMLDRYVWGNVSRISPEAPIPVIHVTKETHVPGGAGNSAFNLARLGANVCVAGVVGDDTARKELISDLESVNIDTSGLIMTDNPTIVKQRVVARDHHIVRMDYEKLHKIRKETCDKIISYVKKKMSNLDALLISDYGKRINSEQLMPEIILLAREEDVPVIVDTKVENYMIYKGVTVFKINNKEASMMTKIPDSSDENIMKMGRLLQEQLETVVLMTRAKEGMLIFDRQDNIKVPTKATKVHDISGAGDTVSSVIALSSSADADIKDAATIASYAAAAVIGKVGTATTDIDEIKDIIKNDFRYL